MDRLTKVAHLILGNTTDDAVVIANKFMKDIFRLHVFLKNIISNQDIKFTFEFCKSLHKEVGTKLNFNFSYHHEMDGKTEGKSDFLRYASYILHEYSY